MNRVSHEVTTGSEVARRFGAGKDKSADGTPLTVIQVDRHRNGISGEPFFAILFDLKGEGRMVAMVGDARGQCAVLRVADLSDERGVTFGINSWRGDNFGDAMRRAIKRWETEYDKFLGLTPEAPAHVRP